MERFPQRLSRKEGEELVFDQQRLLVAFAEPMDREETQEFLSEFDLRLEDGDEEREGAPDEEREGREQRAPTVGPEINHSNDRYWVRAEEDIDEDLVEELLDRGEVDWVGPVYRPADAGGIESSLSVLPHVLLVRLEDDAEVDLAELADRHGLAHREEDDENLEPFHYLRLQEDALAEGRYVADLREELLEEAGVADVRFSSMPLVSPLDQDVPAFAPDDDFFGNQWNMTQVDAPQGWSLTTGENTVLVGVLDSGCDLGDPADPGDAGHPDLNFDGDGYNAGTQTNDGRPTGTTERVRGHGTAVAGIAAALIDNAEGVAGMAGECVVHAVAIPNWTETEVVRALNEATNVAGVDVVNMSFSADGWDESIIDPALDNAHTNDVVMCATAGNDNNNNDYGGPRYPGRHDDTICVGATNQADERCDPTDWGGSQGSCFGDELDVVAPGINTWTTDIRGAPGYNNNGNLWNNPGVGAGPANGNYYNSFGGTSGASPHVAGLAALVRSLDSGLDNDEVRDLIEQTCEKVNPGTYGYANVAGRPNGTWDNEVGYGRINVFDALDEILSVELATPTLTWADQLPNYTTARAAVFDVRTPVQIHLNVTSDPSPEPPFSLVAGGSTTVDPTGGTTQQGTVLVFYTGTSAGTVDSGTVDIACPETGQEWTVDLSGDTKGRNAAGVSLVVDRSGSMNGSSNVDDGTGTVLSRMDLLKRSVDPLLSLLRQQDGIGAVSFSTGVTPLTSLALAGPPGSAGTGRDQTETAIDGLTAGGMTSIGEGLLTGDALFDAPGAPDFGDPNEAVIVFTDGHENPGPGTRDLFHPDVQNAIDSRVFAVGMGTPSELDPGKLQQITDGREGYMMMTGDLQSADRYLLAKYFLQILSDATNADVVTDPEAFLAPGDEHRIPFTLTRADIESDVVLLTPPWGGLFDLTVETPHGDVVDPSTAAGHPQATYHADETATYYRVSLPASIGGRETREGTWHAVVSLDEGQLEEFLSEHQVDRRRREVIRARGMPYNLSVHARSNLRMDATLSQNSREPGASVSVRAVLTEYDLPVEERATVRAEVTRPDGTTSTLSLSEIDPGVFEASFTASMVGLYPIRVRAEGETLHGRRFTREALRTAGVWHAGDTPEPVQPEGGPDERLCRLLECLVEDAFEEPLEEMGVDVDALRKCLAVYCRQTGDGGDEHEEGDDLTRDDFRRLFDDPRIREALGAVSERVGSIRRADRSREREDRTREPDERTADSE
jgi:hypothetical protein